MNDEEELARLEADQDREIRLGSMLQFIAGACIFAIIAALFFLLLTLTGCTKPAMDWSHIAYGIPAKDDYSLPGSPRS